MMQYIWTHAEKFAAITTSIGLVVAIVVLLWTRKQMLSGFGASALHVFELIFTDLNRPALRSARRLLYNCGLSGHEIYANEFVRAKADEVCVSLDRVGVMLRNPLLPKGPAQQLYFDMYVDVFIRCWRVLQDYVDYVRTIHGDCPQHYRNFEALATMAEDYWRKEFPGREVNVAPKPQRHELPEGGNPFVTESSETICEEPRTWFRVRQDKVRLGRDDQGNENEDEPFDYTVAEIGPSVGVVALDANERIHLVGQWRYTLNKYSWEIPTGVIDPKEDEDDCAAAKRELVEESGLCAANWMKLGTTDNSNGSTTDVGHLFLATGLTQRTPQRDRTEIMQSAWVPLWETIELVHDNRITESLSVAAILKAGHYLARNPLEK